MYRRFMAANALLEKTLKKTVPCPQGKNAFRNKYFGWQSFLYFTKIFVHMLVIAAACNFSVYKLIEWNPVKLYLFKFNSRNNRKMCGICPRLTKNTVECRSGVLFVNFKDISQLFKSISVVYFEQVNIFLV